MAANVRFFDGETSWAITQAIANAASPNKRAAGRDALVARIGTGILAQAYRNGALVLQLRLAGALPTSGTDIVISSATTTVDVCHAADLSTGDWTGRVVGLTRSDVGWEGPLGSVTSNAPFKLSQSLTEGGSPTNGEMRFSFPASLDSGGAAPDSADGTSIPPATSLRNLGRTVTLVNGVVTFNGTPDTRTQGVIKVGVWNGGVLYQQTPVGWWAEIGGEWFFTNDPTYEPPPPSQTWSDYTVRTNKRYISPTGNDSADGLTAATAWRFVQPHVADIPADTEVIFLDGIHTGYTSEIYTSYGARPAIAQGITFRSQTLRGATIRGPGTANGGNGGNAFTIDGGERDVEIWGLRLEDWMDQFGNGTITVSNDVDGCRVLMCVARNIGSGSIQDHFVYLAIGSSYATAPRNIKVLGNDVDRTDGVRNGAGLVHSYGDTGWAAHDVEVAHNKVRGNWTWGIIITAHYSRSPATTPTNWRVWDNDIQINASAAVIDFWNAGSGSPVGGGVDTTFILEQNQLVNLGGTGSVMMVRTVSPTHTPITRNNRYQHTAGGTVMQGSASLNMNGGTGDYIGAATGGGGGGTGGPTPPPVTGTILWEGDVQIPSYFCGMHLLSYPTGVAYRLVSPEPTYGYGLVRDWNAGDQTPGNNGIAWSNIDNGAGTFDWTNMDRWVAYQQSKGRFGYHTDGWWKPAAYSANGTIFSKRPPTNLNAYKAWIVALLTRYGNFWKVMTCCNEPNFVGDEGFSGTVSELIQWHKALWDAVQTAKAANPSLTTMVGMPDFVDESNNWDLLATYVAGNYSGTYPRQISDCFAWHLYEFDDGASGGKSPLTVVNGVDRLTRMRQVLRDSGGFTNWDSIPFFDSEHGYYGSFFQNASLTQCATIIKRTAVKQALRKCAAILWYAGDSFGTTDIPAGYPVPIYGTPLEDPPTRYGLIGSPSYHPETAEAFTWQHTFLAGRRVIREESLPNGKRILSYYDGSQSTQY